MNWVISFVQVTCVSFNETSQLLLDEEEINHDIKLLIMRIIVFYVSHMCGMECPNMF